MLMKPSNAKLQPTANPRRPTNVTLDRTLVEEAKAMGINLSQACERGIADQLAKVRSERWLAENRAAIDAYNAHVEEHGLPLARFRQF
jgi:antitoxin CcdA